MPTQTITPVDPQDAHNALIYRDGILDYDAHDAYLVALGYQYLSLPCTCGGTDDDGHMPCCGWGKHSTQPEYGTKLYHDRQIGETEAPTEV